jgi:glycoside/pentoside/hexuronide:cation symporter, GPH family
MSVVGGPFDERPGVRDEGRNEWRSGWSYGWRYGLMGLPLACVALPLYVLLPNYYAREFGLSLATLGAVLLAARLLDAIIDPLLGRWSDRLYAHSTSTVLRWAGLCAALLALGFALLFYPPVRTPQALVLWVTVCLMGTYLAFSALTLLHQAWGAMWGGTEAQRSRIVAWRESWALVGVLMASIVPLALGIPALLALFLIATCAAWWYWHGLTPPPIRLTPASLEAADHRVASLWQPLRQAPFRALLAVFLANGIASALPATLLLFFAQDRLQASAVMEPVFLGVYFVMAALSIPLWLRAVARWGLVRSWLASMGLAVAVFAGVALLGAGDSLWFVLACALTGVAFGADLVAPSALLAGTIDSLGERGRSEGSYFGWWNLVAKLNLALAAGVALPALQAWGYTPGSRTPEALHALTWAYCLLPCLFKLLAAGLLYTLIHRKTPCNVAP